MAVKVEREDFEAVVKAGLALQLGSDPPPAPEALVAGQVAFALGRYLDTHPGNFPAAVVNRRKAMRIDVLEVMDPTVDLDPDDQYHRVERRPASLWSSDRGLNELLCNQARLAARAIVDIRRDAALLADILGPEVEDEP
jgi:hypothetical protein